MSKDFTFEHDDEDDEEFSFDDDNLDLNEIQEQAVALDENGDPVMPAFLGIDKNIIKQAKREEARNKLKKEIEIANNTQKIVEVVHTTSNSHIQTQSKKDFGVLNSLAEKEEEFTITVSINIVPKHLINILNKDGGLNRDIIEDYISNAVSKQNDKIVKEVVSNILGENK